MTNDNNNDDISTTNGPSLLNGRLSMMLEDQDFPTDNNYDWLDYYSETHDDQDPEFMERERKRQEEALATSLKIIDQKGLTTRKEIDQAVKEMMQEKKAQVERGIAHYMDRCRLETKRALARLDARYQEKVAATERKISDKIRQMQQMHQKEHNSLLESHHREVQSRRIHAEHAQSEWQRRSQLLQAKHQQQHQKLTVHTDEYKRRAEVEYKQEQEKLRRQGDQKLSDFDAKRTSVISEFMKQYTATRQKHLKRHLHRVMKEKEALKDALALKYLDPVLLTTTATTTTTTTASPSGPVNAKPGTSTPRQEKQQSSIASPRDMAKSALEHKEELRPPSPFRSIPQWYKDQRLREQQTASSVLELDAKRSDSFETTVGAAMRYKHRKSVLSATVAQSHAHLSIELHNEGLWIDRRTSKSKSSGKSDGHGDGKDGSSSSEDELDFLEWSPRAHQFLESIVNGEIPMSLMKHGRPLEFADSSFMAQSSGQVFCALTDLRVSDATAKQQRAEALQEQEHSSLLELEKKAGEFSKSFNEHHKMLKDEEKEEKGLNMQVDIATKDLDKARKLKEEFLRRYRNYIGADGRPLASVQEKERRDIENKIARFDTNITAAFEKEKAARDRHTLCKKKVQKLQLSAKSTQRSSVLAAAIVKKRKLMAYTLNRKTGKAKASVDANSERILPRMKDVMGMLSRVARKRRDQHNQKKSGNISSNWLQSHPNLPDNMKKNTWRRMHRRRYQIVLRPSTNYLCNELRSRIASSHASSAQGNENSKESLAASLEEKMLKAEELFLRTCHPVAELGLSAMPNSKSTESWGEPGWHLDLSVPKEEENLTNILPRAARFPVLEKNLAEICSVPGRQAASFLSASHLRSLEAPLSILGIVTSPGEIPAALETPVDINKIEMDPLSISEADLRLAYTYIPKPAPPPQRSATQSRRKSTKEEPQSLPAGSKASGRTSSSATNEKKRRVSKADSSPRKRTKKQETNAASTKPQTPSTPSRPALSKVPASSKVTQPAATKKAAVSSPQHQQQQQRPQQQQQQQQASKQRQTPPSRQKPKQIQTQQIPVPNPGQPQPNFHSPHQQRQQQQMAQLRMMHQARPVPGGYQPPASSIQQMQQFYTPLNHPNGPSPRAAGQYRPAMSPNMGRMPPGSGHPGMAMPMPMHPQGMPMPGTVGQPTMQSRTMPAPTGSPQALGVMPGQQANRTMAGTLPTQARPTASQPIQQQRQQQQQQQQQQHPPATAKQQDTSQKDQNDPLFMLK